MKRRQKELLKLLENEENFLPAKYFADKLNVSSRTIYKDINVIESILLNEDNDILKKPGLGIKLNNKKIKTKNIINLGSMYLRRKHIIQRILVENEKVSIRQLSNDYYVSSSSIITDLDFLEKNILMDDCKLNRTSKGTKICGPETSIRKSYCRFNKWILDYEAFEETSLHINKDFLEKIYGKKIVNVCHRVFYDYIKNDFNMLAEHHIFNILNVLIVMTYRVSKQCYINTYKISISNSEIDFIDRSRNLLAPISTRLNIVFTDEEVNYLVYFLIANRINDYVSEENRWDKVIIDLIKRFSINVGENLTGDDRLIENLRMHFPPMIYRLKKNIVTSNPFTAQIIQEFPIVYNSLSLLLIQYEDRLGIVFNTEEIGLLTLYFESALERIQKGSNVIVICQNGVATSELLVNKLVNILPIFTNIQVASVREIDKVKEKADIIITTIDTSIKHKNVVRVSNFLNKKEQETIISRINKNRENFFKRNAETKIAVMQKYLDVNFIFFQKENNTFKDSLTIPLKKLEEEGYVTNEFKKSVFERENKGGTDLEMGVAIPHGNPKFVKKTIISIVINEKKYQWNKHNVDIIFVVAINENDLKEAKAIISDIYKIVNSQKKLEKIRTVKKASDIVKLFNKIERDKL